MPVTTEICIKQTLLWTLGIDSETDRNVHVDWSVKYQNKTQNPGIGVLVQAKGSS